MKMLKKAFVILVYIFACIGFMLVAGYFAVKFGFTNSPGNIDDRYLKSGIETKNEPVWAEDEEWRILKDAIIKDKEVILKASRDSGVNPRLIVAQLTVEQLRLYYTNREIFKQVFAPLKILGNQSQFSWGIMGLKQETAIQIENNLKDTSSPFYLGKNYENLLDFKTNDHNSERFDRIINENNHYYSYLYTGLYLAQIKKQWKDRGYDISNRPEILSTLYNIGFEHSEPKSDPQVGGASIEIHEETYSFGGLAAEFYYSNELLDLFPQ